MNRWKPLVVLGTAQFLMVLDTSVMNVSISRLVEDFDAEVTAIQAVITLYSLVMAAFMIIGGRLGDMFGRRRLFGVGLAVYGLGSLLTALAPTLWMLTLGWSIIEGLGAAMVLPALAALVAGAYRERDRAVAYGVIGGLAGAGVAVGPLLGGWLTSYLTWRLVFVGEVVLVVAMLSVLRWIERDPPPGRHPGFDAVGAVLSATGLALVVLGILQSGSWGFLRPRDAPVTVFGFSPTVFVIGAGALLLWCFRTWERRREEHGRDPLVRFALFGVVPLRSGLAVLLGQNTILLGLFFAIPLYLQVVQGLDAFQTGLRLLPVSVTMLLTSLSGPMLSRLASPRTVVRCALLVLLVAILWLLTTIDPRIDDLSFMIAMALLGAGMGLLASQLGNVVQSSVGEQDRSEVGGLQYTSQNLGSALGTAFMGALVISALAAAFTYRIADDPRISSAVKEQAGIALQSGISFIPSDDVRTALTEAGLPSPETDALVAQYSSAQLTGLKTAILGAGGIALLSLAFTRGLPSRRPEKPSPRA